MKQDKNRFCLNEWNRRNFIGIIIAMVFVLSIIGIIVSGSIIVLLNSNHWGGGVLPISGILFTLFVGGFLIYHILLKKWIICDDDKIIITTQFLHFKEREYKRLELSSDSSLQLTSRQLVGETRYLYLIGKKANSDDAGTKAQIDYLLLLHQAEGAKLIHNNSHLPEIKQLCRFIQEWHPKLPIQNHLKQLDSIPQHQEINRCNIFIVGGVVLLLIMSFLLGSQLLQQELTLDFFLYQPLSYAIVICLAFVIVQIQKINKLTKKLEEAGSSVIITEDE